MFKWLSQWRDNQAMVATLVAENERLRDELSRYALWLAEAERKIKEVQKIVDPAF